MANHEGREGVHSQEPGNYKVNLRGVIGACARIYRLNSFLRGNKIRIVLFAFYNCAGLNGGLTNFTDKLTVPFLACFDSSSGLVYVGPLGCFGADFCPGPSVGVLGLDRQRIIVERLEAWVTIGNQSRYTFKEPAPWSWLKRQSSALSTVK